MGDVASQGDKLLSVGGILPPCKAEALQFLLNL